MTEKLSAECMCAHAAGAHRRVVEGCLTPGCGCLKFRGRGVGPVSGAAAKKAFFPEVPSPKDLRRVDTFANANLHAPVAELVTSLTREIREYRRRLGYRI